MTSTNPLTLLMMHWLLYTTPHVIALFGAMCQLQVQKDAVTPIHPIYQEWTFIVIISEVPRVFARVHALHASKHMIDPQVHTCGCWYLIKRKAWFGGGVDTPNLQSWLCPACLHFNPVIIRDGHMMCVVDNCGCGHQRRCFAQC
jgi:hypothetical protein